MYKYFIVVLILVSGLLAQTTANPDISVIGQLHIASDHDTTILNASNLELAATGYLNPYARAEVYLHKEASEAAFEVEEAYASIERGLPLGLALRAGKFRPTFGKINREHAHLWSFVTTPTAVAQFSGEELWSGTGLEMSWFLPLSWYSQLSASALTSGMSTAAHGSHVDQEDHAGEETVSSPALCLRNSHFMEITPIMHLQAGASYYREESTDKSLAAMDAKLKWKPDAYRGFVLQTEVYFNLSPEPAGDDSTAEHMAQLGTYSYFEYRFNQRWNLGLLLDVVKHHEEDAEISPSVFLVFSPVAESLVLRLVLTDRVEGNEHNPLLQSQLIWSLGPHKPHTF